MSQFNTISGSALRLKLKRKGISSADICRNLGYNKTTVSRYFTNDMAMPATFIVKVAAYALLNIQDLLEGNPDDAQIINTQIINITPPAAITAAAEPPATYESKREHSSDIESASSLIRIDISGLDIIIHELRTKLSVMEEEVKKIKREMELVHQ